MNALEVTQRELDASGVTFLHRMAPADAMAEEVRNRSRETQWAIAQGCKSSLTLEPDGKYRCYYLIPLCTEAELEFRKEFTTFAAKQRDKDAFSIVSVQQLFEENGRIY